MGARRRRGFSPELPRATGSRPDLETFVFPKNVSCGSSKLSYRQNCENEKPIFLKKTLIPLPSAATRFLGNFFQIRQQEKFRKPSFICQIPVWKCKKQPLLQSHRNILAMCEAWIKHPWAYLYSRYVYAPDVTQTILSMSIFIVFNLISSGYPLSIFNENSILKPP